MFDSSLRPTQLSQIAKSICLKLFQVRLPAEQPRGEVPGGVAVQDGDQKPEHSFPKQNEETFSQQCLCCQLVISCLKENMEKYTL